MNYELNKPDICGTHLVGALNRPIADIISVLGQPTRRTPILEQDKVDVEWGLTITTDDGRALIATIYNWKNGPAYCGPDGTPVPLLKNFKVGGTTPEVVFLVEKIIDEAIQAQVD